MPPTVDSLVYGSLAPELLLAAVESLGLRCDATLLALNSYENRVYQIGIEDDEPLVAKFYRPNRWSSEQILEEHALTLELVEAELPVVAPLTIFDQTLHHYEGFRFALFPRQGGRTPELDSDDVLEQMGRTLGRMHAVGRQQQFQVRPEISIESYGDDAVAVLRGAEQLPSELAESFESVTTMALTGVRNCFARAGAYESLRLHADCHSRVRAR